MTMQPIKKPTYIPPFHQILPYLYIGGVDALNTASLFQCIVNCTRHIPLEQHIPSVRIPVHEDPNETANLMEAVETTKVLETIHTARMNQQHVLVHCHAGMQRSCTVVAFYLMKYHQMTPAEVFRFLPTKRPIAFLPQPTFQKAIYRFSSSL
jgi:protein-tyrosine phosphatase